MSEIKYRVWSKKQKTYDYEHPFNKPGDFYITQNGVLFSDYGNVITPEVKQDDFIIEQATGVKDKNGKMIFDGDIVEHNVYHMGIKAYRSKSEVFISDLGARIREDKNDEECSLLRHCTNIEFVGNIHENPELLKKEK